MPLPSEPTVTRAIATLSSVERRLDGAAERLDEVAARAIGMSAQVDWRTESAARFHLLAEAWQREVAMLSGEVTTARDAVGRLRRHLEARAWEPAM